MYIYRHAGIETDIHTHTHKDTRKELKVTYEDSSILDGHVAEEDLPAVVRLGGGSVM